MMMKKIPGSENGVCSKSFFSLLECSSFSSQEQENDEEEGSRLREWSLFSRTEVSPFSFLLECSSFHKSKKMMKKKIPGSENGACSLHEQRCQNG
ncbi:hypothetical protein BaRGS_00007646 [Batillaria attramentaria]|uniref:Uncharacterized protein n=1 Tax=Batillaria attramentaria TaxID=370345 RepID=A0ABD0LNX2_9CAEN